MGIWRRAQGERIRCVRRPLHGETGIGIFRADARNSLCTPARAGPACLHLIWEAAPIDLVMELDSIRTGIPVAVPVRAREAGGRGAAHGCRRVPAPQEDNQ